MFIFNDIPSSAIDKLDIQIMAHPTYGVHALHTHILTCMSKYGAFHALLDDTMTIIHRP